MASEQEYGIILRLTFIFHLIVGFIFGFGFQFVPDLLAPVFGFTFQDPVSRVFGAMTIALTFGSVIALMTRKWCRVKILVEIELIWLSLGPTVLAYHLFVPPLFNLNVVGPIAILLILFIFFLISYLLEIRK